LKCDVPYDKQAMFYCTRRSSPSEANVTERKFTLLSANSVPGQKIWAVKTQSILNRFGQTCLSYFVGPLFLFVVAQFSELPILK
jgi:hypothetical protein